MRRGGTCAAGFFGHGGDRYAGSEKNPVILIKRPPSGAIIIPKAQRQVHAVGDILVVRLFTASGFTRITQQGIGIRHELLP